MKVKEIPLTQGKFAIVDEDDYEWLSQYKWYAYKDKKSKTYYARRNIWTGKKKQTAIQMHRMVMGCSPKDGKTVDHINFDGLDNRKVNLQAVPRQINIHRRLRQKNNHTGYIGIQWKKKKKWWEAWVTLDKKKTYCGHSKDPREAAGKRDKVVAEYYEKNAILNFPLEAKP